MSDTIGGCCRFVFTLGLTALFMWLSLRTSNPKCSIEKFYLPSLNKTLNTPNDTTLNLTLKLSNPNKDKGIKYDPVNVTVFDYSNRSHVIGNVLVPAFYQGHKKNAKKDGTGTANTTVALQAVADNGTGVFRVDLSTSVKFKIMFWYTKRHRIRVGADVTVNASGIKVNKKGIKLKSMAPPRMGSFCVVMGALANLLAFSLLNFW
ncbi:trafficking protein particle complex subunit 3-like [Hibiscus syriacus]|uniref:Trafficking protein particle complex subunit 3-like n=1 Tax=Hibiscus syriacus TaxID=106335 RepID=A0A6A2YNZ2_HIBSY|nr:protein NDR1-like [Hibiscus syriacus]KAE8681039.1 trafficking protein particle complex subunit 3-like [Hibiscus syriacus]